MDMAVLYEVVVPLMELDRTALICISTVLGADNFYSKLLKLKDDKGEDFFKKHEFYLACKTCMDKGMAAECTHKMNELPSWQSARKHQRIQAMMADQQELLEREMMGISRDSAERAFPSHKVNELFDKPRFALRFPVRHVFVAADPNGGGASRFAICAMFHYGGACVIAGTEAYNTTNPHHYYTTFVEHLTTLRAHPMLRDATIVLILESNLGMESHHMWSAIQKRNLPYVCCMRGSDGSPGLLTMHQVKEASRAASCATFYFFYKSEKNEV